jgi:hypothetical protein
MKEENFAVKMKHNIFNLLFFCLISLSVNAQHVYISSNGQCSFHSSTPVEDIDAVSDNLNSVLNIKNNEILFKVAMTSFRFDKQLMREHFNEKYIESEKFPYASFKGRIIEPLITNKDTSCQITAEGLLNVHGVEKFYKEKGTFTVKNGTITISAGFKVALKDHDIKVPKIVMANISEVIDVDLSCSYKSYKKK